MTAAELLRKVRGQLAPLVGNDTLRFPPLVLDAVQRMAAPDMGGANFNRAVREVMAQEPKILELLDRAILRCEEEERRPGNLMRVEP